MQYFSCYVLASKDSSLKIDVYQINNCFWKSVSNVLFDSLFLFPVIWGPFNNVLSHTIKILTLWLFN